MGYKYYSGATIELGMSRRNNIGKKIVVLSLLFCGLTIWTISSGDIDDESDVFARRYVKTELYDRRKD
jgi:hypothetical protein